jgi:hypothetical protein
VGGGWGGRAGRPGRPPPPPPGGTVIIKLGQPEHHLTARVLWMLDMLSSRLVTYKPRTMHASKNMFYAVAFGVGKGRNGRKMNDYWMVSVRVRSRLIPTSYIL